MKRVDLVYLEGIKSSYIRKDGFLDVKRFGESAKCTADMKASLLELDLAVAQQNGSLHITDLFRDWKVQDELRKKYESNPKKRPFAARPGGSFHQAGRAVDIAIQMLNFKDVPKDKWLQKLWDLAKPLGFKPIIRIPDMNASEAWHFDRPGKAWDAAYKALPYDRVAKCAIIECDNWDPNEDKTKLERMFIQTQLIRLGNHEIGDVDGILGTKTMTVLNKMLLASKPLQEVAETLKAL